MDKCGDGYDMIYPCDELKGNELDGCTDQCQVEDNFECYLDGTNSICSYNGDFGLEMLSMEKEMFANSITLQLRLSPPLFIFESVTPVDLMVFNDSGFQNVSGSYDSGLLSLTFTYSEDMQGRPFDLSLKPSLSSNPHFYATSDATWSFTLATHELLPVLYYSD